MLETGDQAARVGLQPGREPGGAVGNERPVGIVPLDGVKWAKVPEARSRPRSARCSSRATSSMSSPSKTSGQFRLQQIPEVSGAIVAMDPWTGRVLAMVGGFSYDQSQFNRATQALRQPGSSFKPFVYAAALDNGYTPSSVVMDAPLEIDQGAGQAAWAPQNYEGKFYGPVHAAVRHRALAQRHDGAARAGCRHAADCRIRQAVRHL